MDFLLNSAEHHWSTLMTLVCRLTSNSPSYMRSVVLTCFYFSLGWSLLSTGAPRYIKVHSEKNDHTKRPLITSVACVFVFTDGHYQKNKILILWASVIEKKKKEVSFRLICQVSQVAATHGFCTYRSIWLNIVTVVLYIILSLCLVGKEACCVLLVCERETLAADLVLSIFSHNALFEEVTAPLTAPSRPSGSVPFL